MASFHDFPAAPLMAWRLRKTPSRAVPQPIHDQQKYECVHQLDQSPEAQLPPVVDHLVVKAPVTTFVTYVIDTIPGVRISSASQDAVESIDVRVHRDTGIEIDAATNRSERILVEVFLPTPQSLRLVDARDRATVILESAIASDGKADVRIHHVGECQIFLNSPHRMDVRSLTLDPQGGGLIQLIAPAIHATSSVEANVAAMGKIRIFTGKLTAPTISMQTAGFGSVQLAALEVDAFAKVSMSAVGQASVRAIGDTFRAALLTSSANGMGTVDVLAFQELLVNGVQCEAQGSGQVYMASHYAHCDGSRVSVAGKGLVDARDLVARDANIHVAGAATAIFRASEAAHITTGGYGTATLVGVLPPRVTGRPTTAPAMASLVEERAAHRKPPITVPSRGDAFAHRDTPWAELHLPNLSDFTSALKVLWGGGSHQGGRQEAAGP